MLSFGTKNIYFLKYQLKKLDSSVKFNSFVWEDGAGLLGSVRIQAQKTINKNNILGENRHQ